MAAKLVLGKCPCLKPKLEEEVRVLDYRHSSLTDVPGDVFNFERTLEELYTDSNQIRDLPRELFYCHGLRKLSICDNEITSIPPAIASLDHLEELDFSKNGIIDVPDNIKCCKYLRVIDASVNPMGKLPEGFTQLQNLTHLYLNDTFLDYLPGSFGRLVKLRILEIRENHLKTLPKSFGRLADLERLDIGNNEFTDLPDVIGSLGKLLELWCDNNQLATLTHSIGSLKQLMFLDASNNEMTTLPGELEGCVCLADLHLTSNQLTTLPQSIGNLTNLTTLKVDDNQLTALPNTLGGLASLSELNVSMNDLQELPPSIGLLRNLRTFYADENLLSFVPAELGSCSGITVLSLRSNRLTYIPDEIGRIPRLRVLNLSDNRLSYLPFTIVKLKELQALWLTENQTRPLIPLQSDYETDTGRKILTCYLLPQGHGPDNDDGGGDGDTDSFHASIWDEERLRRQQIHFDFDDGDDDEGHLVRCPTPYPKEMREKARHMRNLAMRQSMGETAQPSSWSPHTPHAQRVAQDKADMTPTNGEAGASEGQGREPRTPKPPSPSRQETHRLYRFDKEKQMKDKARMLHRHSNPDIPDDFMVRMTPRAVKSGGRKSAGSDTEEGRVSGRRKSTPNLFSFDVHNTEQNTGRKPSLTYEDLYRTHIVHKHHHHSRRSRRMRDYDSDTGARSDHEAYAFHRHYAAGGNDDLSVRSQPTMSRSGRRGSRREGGYASDLESYAGRGRGWGGDKVTGPSHSPKPGMYRLHPSHSLPQDLEAHVLAPRPADPTMTGRKTYLDGSNSHPTYGSHGRLAPPSPSPSPAPFTPGSLLDQSTPLSKQPPRPLPSPPRSAPAGLPLARGGRGGGGVNRDLHRELFSVLERRRKNSAQQDLRVSSIPSSSHPGDQHSHSHNPTPAYSSPANPNNPANSAYHNRPVNLVNPGNSANPGNQGSPANPGNQASPANPGNRASPANPGKPPGRFSGQASPRDKLKAASKSYSNPEYTAVHYSAQERRQRAEWHNDDSNRNYETVAMLHYGQDVYSSSVGSSQRTCQGQGQGEGSRSHHVHFRDGASQGERVGNSYQSQGTGGQSGVASDSQGRERLSGQDQSVSSRPSSVGGSQTLSSSSFTHHTTQTPASSLSDHSRINRSSAQLSHADIKHSPRQYRDSSPPSRPRSGSRETLDDNASPRRSSSPQKVFESYPNPYGDPMESGRPLMSSYEDVAVFKSVQDPSSQVSSSTDSGYGHGHNGYERIGDFKRSGSPHSSTPPSQRNTSLHHNSSSQGTPSRETTPVKEEGFYSVHGNLLSETSSRESRDVFRSVIRKNPGLGFSIAGGQGSRRLNPFRAGDAGIFVTKVQADGPAASIIRPGDKILQVNHIDFRHIDHTTAVNVLKTSATVELLVERIQTINMV